MLGSQAGDTMIGESNLNLLRQIPGGLSFVLLLASPALPQVLVAVPGCGEAGKTTVCVTGSGWAEPEPVCRYKFFFDGTQVVFPDQPDGLFGPPRRSFTVPAAAAPGQHKIRVELRLNSPDKLLQAKETPFKVVVAIKEPWTVTVTIVRINSSFDPTDVCDVTPCTKIVFIQVLTQIGTKADGTTRVLKPSDFKNFPNSTKIAKDVTVSGFQVDYLFGEKDPYYNGDDLQDPGTQGVQDGAPKASTTSDAPATNEANWPADITKVTREFEMAAFCTAGTNAGEFLGKITWTFEKEKGKAASSSLLSTSRDQPSQNFRDALSLWNTNHGFTSKFPKRKTPTCP